MTVDPVNVVNVPVELVKMAPPKFRFPAPVKVIEALPVLPDCDTSPDTVTVPVEIVTWCLTLPPPLVNAILPAFSVPAPTETRFSAEPDLGMVTAPETVSVTPELIVKDVAVVVVNVIEAQAASAVTETLCPPSIVTVSPATGTLAPATPPEVVDHVAVEFQLPVATAYRDAASAGITGNAAKASITIISVAATLKINGFFIYSSLQTRMYCGVQKNKMPEYSA